MSHLVTVYITNYNYDQYIASAVDSVLNQSYQNFELIIIDDGSTDGSKQVIESYADNPKIKIIYQQNKGLNVTNNIAMRAASGDFIIRLDADDFLHPEALEILSNELISDPELGLVFPDYFYVDQKGDKIGEQKRHDFENEVELLDQPAHGACTMIRLDFLKAVGGYNESYNCQDGYELWVKFIRRFKIRNVSKSLFYYRQHGENLTGNENKILETRARINQNFIQDRKLDASTLAIIPVRGGSGDLAFRSINGLNILEQKLKMLGNARNVKRIVISSPDQAVEDLLRSFELSENVEFHLREQSEARYNQSLNPTIRQILDWKKDENTCIALITLQFPFLTAEKVDDTVNTMLVFESDSIIGVRSDNSIFYQHHGDGLHPILSRNQYTKLEREALFKQVGGITAVTKEAFGKSSEMMTGNVGHVMMDQRTSIGLFSKFDWELVERLS